MRCLFVVPQIPITPDFRGGGAAVVYEHLRALHDLGHEIDLWHFSYPEERREFDQVIAAAPERWQEVASMCRSVTVTTFRPEASMARRLWNRVCNTMLKQRVMNPALRSTAGKLLANALRRSRPDFIWAEHFAAAQVCLLQSRVPVVYTHHDWLYRIKALARGAALDPRVRLSEEWVSRKARAVVTGSAVEMEDLRRLGCRNVAYIPVSYEHPPWSPYWKPEGRPRLVHLGDLRTTASRLGLERFVDVVWPKLVGLGLQFDVIGDAAGATAKIEEFLHAVNWRGFVPKLQEVLRPFDIHVIPWEYNTGQRTRLVLAFGYGQAVVAVRASIACFPEARDRENCRLVDRIDEMHEVIQELASSEAERLRLGLAARQTFERCFSRPALLPRFGTVVASVVPRGT